MLTTSLNVERFVTPAWTPQASSERRQVERAATRRPVVLPARLIWKDQRGSSRFAAVVTRNVSEIGVFVECPSPVSIPLHRLVYFQIDGDLTHPDLPATLRQGRLLSAVYRVRSATASGIRQGFALRLMVDPKQFAGLKATERATA
jgi:hypothetical protein